MSQPDPKELALWKAWRAAETRSAPDLMDLAEALEQGGPNPLGQDAAAELAWQSLREAQQAEPTPLPPRLGKALVAANPLAPQPTRASRSKSPGLAWGLGALGLAGFGAGLAAYAFIGALAGLTASLSSTSLSGESSESLALLDDSFWGGLRSDL